MAVWQVFKPFLTGSDRLLSRMISLNCLHEMVVIVQQLQLHNPGQSGIASQREGCFLPVASRFYKRAKAHPLETLGDGTAVPPQCLRGRLHIELLLAKAGEDGLVAGRLDREGRGGLADSRALLLMRKQSQVIFRNHMSFGQGDCLLETLLDLTNVAFPCLRFYDSQGLLGQSQPIPPELRSSVTNEPLRQKSEIVSPFPKRR